MSRSWDVRPMRDGLWVWSITAAAVVIIAVGNDAQGALAVREAAKERAIEADLARRDPELAGRFKAATVAYDADRLDEARAGFEAVLVRVPEHAPSLRRLSRIEGVRNGPRALV